MSSADESDDDANIEECINKIDDGIIPDSLMEEVEGYSEAELRDYFLGNWWIAVAHEYLVRAVVALFRSVDLPTGLSPRHMGFMAGLFAYTGATEESSAARLVEGFEEFLLSIQLRKEELEQERDAIKQRLENRPPPRMVSFAERDKPYFDHRLQMTVDPQQDFKEGGKAKQHVGGKNCKCFHCRRPPLGQDHMQWNDEGEHSPDDDFSVLRQRPHRTNRTRIPIRVEDIRNPLAYLQVTSYPRAIRSSPSQESVRATVVFTIGTQPYTDEEFEQDLQTIRGHDDLPYRDIIRKFGMESWKTPPKPELPSYRTYRGKRYQAGSFVPHPPGLGEEIMAKAYPPPPPPIESPPTPPDFDRSRNAECIDAKGDKIDYDFDSSTTFEEDYKLIEGHDDYPYAQEIKKHGVTSFVTPPEVKRQREIDRKNREQAHRDRMEPRQFFERMTARNNPWYPSRSPEGSSSHQQPPEEDDKEEIKYDDYLEAPPSPEWPPLQRRQKPKPERLKDQHRRISARVNPWLPKPSPHEGFDESDEHTLGADGTLDAGDQDLDAGDQDLDASYQDLGADDQDLDAGYQDMGADDQDLDAGYEDLDADGQDLDEGIENGDGEQQPPEIVVTSPKDDLMDQEDANEDDSYGYDHPAFFDSQVKSFTLYDENYNEEDSYDDDYNEEGIYHEDNKEDLYDEDYSEEESKDFEPEFASSPKDDVKLQRAEFDASKIAPDDSEEFDSTFPGSDFGGEYGDTMPSFGEHSGSESSDIPSGNRTVLHLESPGKGRAPVDLEVVATPGDIWSSESQEKIFVEVDFRIKGSTDESS